MIKVIFKSAENEEQRVVETYHAVKVSYIKEDKALISLRGGGNCFLCTGCAYINFSFDLESKRIGGIGDFLGDLDKLKKKEVIFAETIREGILYVESLEELQAGAGYDLSLNGLIYYDSKNKILQLGKYDKSMELLKILGNVYVQIQENLIQGILITEIE